MFNKYLFPLSILPIQSFGDHVKEEGGFGFIKSELFMELFGDVSESSPMVIKVNLTAMPHNEDDGVFVPEWAFEILNADEPVRVEKMDTEELPVIKTIIVRMFIENELVKETLEGHFYDFKVLHSNIWFKIDGETVIVEHLFGEDGDEIMFGRLTDELAVTVNVSKDIEPFVEPFTEQEAMPVPVSPIINSIADEPRELAPPVPPTEEEKRKAREARLKYFTKNP
jgi:hypothetical protein